MSALESIPPLQFAGLGRELPPAPLHSHTHRSGKGVVFACANTRVTHVRQNLPPRGLGGVAEKGGGQRVVLGADKCLI